MTTSKMTNSELLAYVQKLETIVNQNAIAMQAILAKLEAQEPKKATALTVAPTVSTPSSYAEKSAAATIKFKKSQADMIAHEPVTTKKAKKDVTPSIPTNELDFELTHERAWTWIKFSGKPTPEVCAALVKQLGGRFTTKRGGQWHFVGLYSPDQIMAVINSAE